MENTNSKIEAVPNTERDPSLYGKVIIEEDDGEIESWVGWQNPVADPPRAAYPAHEQET